MSFQRRPVSAPAAFTLIELIIVVAIIAILSAIAVPNFLEAQARSKISRAKSDMRALATGIEAYSVDWGHAPRGNFFQMSTREMELAQGDKGLILLSTPVVDDITIFYRTAGAQYVGYYIE